MWYQSLVALDLGRRIAPYTPQQNGVAEKKNRVLQDMINVVLVSANLPKNLWGEALLTVCHPLIRQKLWRKVRFPTWQGFRAGGNDSGGGGKVYPWWNWGYGIKTGWRNP
ncbi:zinc finger, CCHC-type containing protein [Tanacetum coccineum]